jgi:hypothetical protein
MKIDNVQIFGMLCGVYLGVCVPSSGRCLHFLPLTALFALFKPTDLISLSSNHHAHIQGTRVISNISSERMIKNRIKCTVLRGEREDLNETSKQSLFPNWSDMLTYADLKERKNGLCMGNRSIGRDGWCEPSCSSCRISTQIRYLLPIHESSSMVAGQAPSAAWDGGAVKVPPAGAAVEGLGGETGHGDAVVT